MFENKEEIAKAILVQVDVNEFDCESSMRELAELTTTAGAEVAAKLTQKRVSYENSTCIGEGKLTELAELANSLEADLIIFDHELTATQIRNIENTAKVRTIDRTMLILDIFARRAVSAEGRLQVELAQLRYRLPRLAGIGATMSRLRAGIGARGPGETKLESDKRHIRSRITLLEAELSELTARRQKTRIRRKKESVLVAAIVGYTNVGKSTLMNALTNAGVLAEDKLFATLDTTARALLLPDGRKILLIDTVGLISRLPHHLIEAFKSTLEEAANSDLIIHMIDASHEEASSQAEVTRELLKEIGCEGISQLNVFNKIDLINEDLLPAEDDKNILISAKKSLGIDRLITAIAAALPVTSKRVKINIPFSMQGILNTIRIDGMVYSEEYTEDGIIADALIDIKIFHTVEKFVMN